MMSASAPAGIASSITGRLSAASTSATIDGDADNDVISQPAPTSCIHVPTFETIVAIQSPRKSGLCSGVHGEAAAATRAVSAPSLMSTPSGRPALPKRGLDCVEKRLNAERHVLHSSIDEE